MYGWICLNYMMICNTKYIEDLMLVYIFLSITLREGGKFTINRAKHLFRLIKLQPGKYLFRLLAESSFFVHTPSVQCLKLYFVFVIIFDLPVPLHKFWWANFL